MDMLGIFSTTDRTVELHRVGFKHQKVFAKEDLVGPTSLAFNEGNAMFLLAVGYEDGKVVIINAENAEELFTTKIIDFGAPITSMHWQDNKRAAKVEEGQGFTKHVKGIQICDPAKVK
jgi:hypothetical protein